MAGSNVVHIEGNNWEEEVLKSELPVLVDFWAEWCGPCRAIAPLLDEISESLDGKLKVAKVNVDNNQQLASEFNVRSIPTLLIMKGGEVKEQMVGAMNRAALQDKLQPYVQG
jgi:thioredoxin 1